MRISNNLVALMVVVMIALSATNVYRNLSEITAAVSTTDSTVEVCVNGLPPITDVPDLTVSYGASFYFDVNSSSDCGETFSFSDYTDLFDINSTTGIINFTTTRSDMGSNDIIIGVCDNAGCTNDSFRLLVTGEDAEEVSSGGGGAGGGGAAYIGPLPKDSEFAISEDLIDIKLKRGENYQEEIGVINTGETELDIRTEIRNLDGILTLSEESFYLNMSESKTIKVNILAPEKADAYTGRIIITSNNITRVINVLIEVIDDNMQLDVQLIKEEVMIDETVSANISITSTINDEANIYYAIKELDGETVIAKEERIIIDGNMSIFRELEIPSGYSCVDYSFYTRLSYMGESAAGAKIFRVSCKKDFLSVPVIRDYSNALILVLICALILVVIVRLYLVRINHKNETNNKKTK